MHSGSFPSSAPPASFGDHHVLGLLGEGGMGTLYLTRALRAGGFLRLFAIKVLHPHLARQPMFARMLLDEARISARIQHPHVVAVFDVVDGPEASFIVMDYVHGETLGFLFRQTLNGNWISRELAAFVARNVLEGLHAAHELSDERGQSLGIVHRDVSPGNIMLGYDGSVRVMDFGVAKARDNLVQTSTGSVRGTYAYMAPEYIEERRVDRRADVFAVGTILWEATTRRRLFKGNNDVITANKVLRAQVPRPSELVPDYPPALESIVLRALAREPDDRYATAREMADALDGYLRAGQPVGPGALESFMRGELASRYEERECMRRAALDRDAQPKNFSSMLLAGPRGDSLPALLEGQPKPADAAATPKETVSSPSDPALEATVSEASASPGERQPDRPWLRPLAVIGAVATALGVAAFIAFGTRTPGRPDAREGGRGAEDAAEAAAQPRGDRPVEGAAAPARDPALSAVIDTGKDLPSPAAAGPTTEEAEPSPPPIEVTGAPPAKLERSRKGRGRDRTKGADRRFLVIDGSDL